MRDRAVRMNASILLSITGDPRKSSKPAEAIRIAAGLAAGKDLKVFVYLRGPAVLVLGAGNGDLIDEESMVRYLPSVADKNHPILVASGSPLLPLPGEEAATFAEMGDTELVRFMVKLDSICSF